MAKKEPQASDKATCKEWWKHLRPFLKRKASKARRKGAQREIARQTKEAP